jgi:hypothetical protein
MINLIIKFCELLQGNHLKSAEVNMKAMGQAYIKSLISQINYWLPPNVKNLMNTAWAMLTASALYTAQDRADEGQDICPINFNYSNNTFFPSSAGTDSLFPITPSLLIIGSSVIATPLIWYLVKKLWPYLHANEIASDLDDKRLATPIVILEALAEHRRLFYADRRESLKYSVISAFLLSSLILVTCMPRVEKLISDYTHEKITEEYQTLGSASLLLLLTLTNFFFSLKFFFHRDKQRQQAFYDAIADHATAITLGELKEYKNLSSSNSLKPLLFPLIIVLTPVIILRIQYLKLVILSAFLMAYKGAQLGGLFVFLIDYCDHSKQIAKINRLFLSHLQAISKSNTLFNCIHVTKDEHDILNFFTSNSLLNGLSRKIWFAEMVSFCQEKFGHNPLYINSKKFNIQMIPLDTEPCSQMIWLGFNSRFNELQQKMKSFEKFVKAGNSFFQTNFKIKNAMRLIPHYGDTNKFNFIFELDITSLDTNQQQIVADIMQEVLKTEVINSLVNLSIGPIAEIDQKQIQKIKSRLQNECKSLYDNNQQISPNQIRYIIPDRIFLKRKNKPKPKGIEEKTSVTTVPTTLFAPKPVSFGDYGFYNPSDPKCLIKPLPDGPPNTFLTMDPVLLEKLKGSQHEASIVWFTRDYDEKKHTPPKIAFKPKEKVNADGSIPFLKMYLEGENRIGATQCIKVTPPDQKTTYTLYILDSGPYIIHDRTSHADSSAQQKMERRHTITI